MRAPHLRALEEHVTAVRQSRPAAVGGGAAAAMDGAGLRQPPLVAPHTPTRRAPLAGISAADAGAASEGARWAE